MFLFTQPVMLFLPMKLLVTMHLLLLVTVSLECPEKTTLSILRFLNLDSAVKAKLMEVTMLTLRLNVKHSIFAQLMELEVLPSTASSVLMEHSSTRTISSVIGGSTLTAPLLRNFTLSMMRLLLNAKLLLELPPMLLVPMRLLLTMPLLMKLPLFTNHQKPGLPVDSVEGEITGVEITELDQDQDKPKPHQPCQTRE